MVVIFGNVVFFPSVLTSRMIVYAGVLGFEENPQRQIKNLFQQGQKDFEDFPPSAGTPLILPSLKGKWLASLST
jgi:hypothetical protein